MRDWDTAAALADELHVGLLLVDDGDRIAAANRMAHELLRTRMGSLPGKSTIEAFLDHRAEELLRSARAQQVGVSGDYALAGEPPRTLAVRAWPAAGGTYVALEDVSELRRLRRIRSEFIDNLSHELRTPLTTLRLLAESLALEAQRDRLPARVSEAIDKIEVETGHVVRMVDELLDLAAIEQGEAPLRLEPVDLGEVVDSTLERLRGYASRQGVTLRADLPEHAVATRTVPGDAGRIGQILVNVVDNAIKFSPTGGEVVVHVRPVAHEVVIEVEDHGPGIAHDDLERIFERFYKSDRARARGRGGTGLGLSIARHVAQRHGGRMWARSDPGHGAQLFLALPRGRDEGERQPAG